MSRNVKVGIFVAAGILVASLLIFLIGDERHLFDRAVELRASFNDVGGLRVGGPVRMGGVDVGQVVAIEFGQQEADRRIHIRFTLVARELVRVRRDSVVRIASKGLLGDKALDLTMGSPREPALRANTIAPPSSRASALSCSPARISTPTRCAPVAPNQYSDRSAAVRAKSSPGRLSSTRNSRPTRVAATTFQRACTDTAAGAVVATRTVKGPRSSSPRHASATG
jgi:hypothetical protein